MHDIFEAGERKFVFCTAWERARGLRQVVVRSMPALSVEDRRAAAWSRTFGRASAAMPRIEIVSKGAGAHRLLVKAVSAAPNPIRAVKPSQ